MKYTPFQNKKVSFGFKPRGCFFKTNTSFLTDQPVFRR